MQAHGFVRKLNILLMGVGPLVLAACGGGGSDFNVGSSSGGTGAALQGTFFGYTGNSQRGFAAPSTQTDSIFGVVASDGSGFFADTQVSGSQAVFSMGVASSTGSSAVNGFFTAYAGNGSNLGDGTTIALNGNLTGKLTSTSTGTQAALTYSLPSGSNNSTNIVLDTPALTVNAIATGTYSAANGSAGTATVASAAISANTADTYTISFNTATSFTIANVSGCNFSGTATADGTFNILHLTASGSCPGSGTITLNGLASYLAANGHSPLGGLLAKNSLVLELDDSRIGNPPKYALALVAAKQ
ncbi:MAG: hypothetical protein JWR07_297 [Nevskia sp.]|nr:hypothetical protein [Nevskia sp.]